MDADQPTAARPNPLRGGAFLRELPYGLMLLLTLGGIGFASMTREPIQSYWAFVALFNCAASIFAGWHFAKSSAARWRLVWTQCLHWGAFLAVISAVFLPDVQAIADADSTSLLVMLLVALGTFVAGVHTMSWRMGLNGIIMAAFVPAVAWLDKSALLLAFGGMLVAVIVVGTVLLRHERHAATEHRSRVTPASQPKPSR